MSGKEKDEASVSAKEDVALSRLRKRQKPPKPDSDLPIPLGLFAEHDQLRRSSELTGQEVKETKGIKELRELELPAREFLSVQAEMLIESKEHYNTKPKLLDASFDYFTLKNTCAGGYDGLYIAGDSTRSKNRIEAGLNRGTTNFGDLLAHEMSHAIDDIYDNRRCINREVDVLKGLPTTDQKTIIETAKNVFEPDIREVFQKEYIEPAFVGEKDFVAACKSGTEKDSELSKQEQDAITLSKEFTSFSYETLFYEKRTSGAGGFIERYSALSATSEGMKAQELIASSMYGVNQHMIEHIRGQVGKTEIRRELLENLEHIQGVLEAPYSRARSSALEPKDWVVDTVKSKREATGAGIPSHSETGAAASSSFHSDSPRISNSVEVFGEDPSAIYREEASRMRDSLTREEAKSGGKAKYGDLKRTMSPIRRRPATVLGGRM